MDCNFPFAKITNLQYYDLLHPKSHVGNDAKFSVTNADNLS